MHSGFANLRSALPMNLDQASGIQSAGPGQLDVDRVVTGATAWRRPAIYLFGEISLADAMYAPVCRAIHLLVISSRSCARLPGQEDAEAALHGGTGQGRRAATGDEVEELKSSSRAESVLAESWGIPVLGGS